MPNRYLHWCPNECGKQVIFTYFNQNGSERESVYQCRVCKEYFTKKQLEE